jgi:hypothetical protein
VGADEGISIALDGVFQAGTVPVDVEGNTAGTNSFIYNKCIVAKLGAAAASILSQNLELQGEVERGRKRQRVRKIMRDRQRKRDRER